MRQTDAKRRKLYGKKKSKDPLRSAKGGKGRGIGKGPKGKGYKGPKGVQ